MSIDVGIVDAIGGSMKLTDKRTAQLENTLRKLRQRCFEDPKAERLIPIVKQHLSEVWRNRQSRHTQKHWMYAAE